MGMAHMSALEKRDAALVAAQGKVRRNQGDARTVVPKLLSIASPSDSVPAARTS